jgi:hypothetical protein
MNDKLNMILGHQPIKEKMSVRVTTPPTRKCVPTGKVNSIDYQRVTSKKHKINRQQTGKTGNEQ